MNGQATQAWPLFIFGLVTTKFNDPNILPEQFAAIHNQMRRGTDLNLY